METAAVVHDIGILTAERKYDSSAGKCQELEGSAEAKDLLSGLGWPQEVIDRVCYLVRHHHTYANIDKPDDKIFRTKSGKNLFRLLYPCMQQKTV